LKRFATFVGIDQTGAVVGGVPKPLPAARLAPDGSLAIGKLAHADRASIVELAGTEADLAIVVDAVIGLPARCWRGNGADDVWALLGRTHRVPGYGRAAAESFFHPFIPSSRSRADAAAALPRRACEIAADANSVLTTRPYQKNVQTGTFRIWKDLTRDAARWVSLWPFEARRARPWLFEGYPSYVWTRVFGFARRSPARIRELAQRAATMGVRVNASRATLAAVAADADLADAVALAIGAACLQTSGRLVAPYRGFGRHLASARRAGRAREGWIMGVVP
jgi:hypothetical protein